MRTAVNEGFDGVEFVAPFAAGAIGVASEAPAAPRNVSGKCHAVADAVSTTNIETAIHETTALLTAAAEIRAACVNLSLPPLSPTVTDDRPVAAFRRYQDQLNFAFQLLHRARFAAERHGVALALECASGGGLLSPVELRELVDEANSIAVGVCLDVKRVARHGSPVDWLQTLRHRVHSVRIEADENADALLSSLQRWGFEGSVILDGPEALGRVRAVLAPGR